MHKQPHDRLTRRALAGGLALTLAIPRSAHTQSSPEAEPDRGYIHPEWLVDVAWVASHLDDPAVLLIGLVDGDTFAQGFIPASVNIDWPNLELADTSTMAALDDWQAGVERRLTNLGLTRERTAVVWDDGSLFAARLFWVLHYLGHDDVRMLNGGLPAWRAAGHDVEVDAPEPPTPAKSPYVGVPRPEVLATLDEAAAWVGNEGVTFVDARSAAEYAEGHIPGAVNLPYPLNALPDPPRFWRSADDLARLYQEAGVSPYTRVIPYCSTGVRSAVTWLSLPLAGYPDAALFSGSWMEWSRHPDLPVTTGDAP